MNEDSIIARLRGTGLPACVGLKLGIGDDCAVYRPRSNEELLFTTDFSIEGVHFKRDTKPEQIGRRALARSLSDIAAMGGTPRFCLVSLAVTKSAKERWIDSFYRGLLEVARHYKTALAGGDLSHANQIVCDVMVCGSVTKGKALRRDGARPGDIVYVSGPLGGWRLKPDPHPRIAFGRKLIGKATACMDISDGLSLDLRRLCVASNVAASLDFVPRVDGATIEQALHDGEDYELLFTATPKTRVPGIAIGVITKGKPGKIVYQGKPLPALGYDHFRHRP
jgi:thiamine-monophosphate kinase